MDMNDAEKIHIEDIVTRRFGCKWNEATRKAAFEAAKTVGEPIMNDELVEEFSHHFWANFSGLGAVK